MGSPYGGIVAVKTVKRYYGIQARVLLPSLYTVEGPDKHNYFDAYLAFTNPFAEDDPRAEAGIFKYGARGDQWTYFIWALGANGWRERNVPLPAGGLCHLKLVFSHGDFTAVSLYINGALEWTQKMGRPISQSTYDSGGLQMKACIGMDDELNTVSFDRITMSDIKVCADAHGATWLPLDQVEYTPVVKQPAPTPLGWNPLSAMCRARRAATSSR
jgi:hypothetical protein